MAAYPDLRSEPVSVDHFVRKIVLLCDRHDVAWGTPEKLAGFMRALKDNKHLAMDFWSVVALMSEESSIVGPEPHRLLEVIVEGVTGRSVAEVIAAGPAERQAVHDLASLLAGEDIWSPVGKNAQKEEKHWIEENSSRQATAAKLDAGTNGSARVNGSAKEVARETSGPASARRGAEGSVSEAVERAPVVSAPISASRPAAPTRPAPLPPSPPLINSRAAEADRRLKPLYGDEGDTRPRIFLEPEPLPAEPKTVRSEGEPFHVAPEPPAPPFVDREAFRRERWREGEYFSEPPQLVCVDDPLIRIPLSEYSETSKSRKGLVAGVVVLVIVGVGAFAALVARGGLGQKLQLGIEGVRDSIAQNSIIQSVHDKVMGSGQTASVKTSSPVSGGGMDSGGSTTGSQESVASEPTPTTVDGGSAASAPAAASDGASGAGAAVKEGSNRGASPQGEQETAPTRPQIAEPADAEAGGAVQVPSDVMTSHLISSRVPVYPEEAKVHHAEGPVVMQAVITKSGWVGHLHVLSGDPALRAAALAAVATWRYRPYMQNGEPVDVLTTISVEFPADW